MGGVPIKRTSAFLVTIQKNNVLPFYKNISFWSNGRGRLVAQNNADFSNTKKKKKQWLILFLLKGGLKFERSTILGG